MKMRELGRTGIQVSPYCLAGAATVLDDKFLDRIDQIVAPGTDIGPLDVSYTPPALNRASLRRRSADERTAA
ncbi:hypothetical protein AB0M44_38015 [Streptosporangium subroseum]|uniref:hypothetical protein n=1 Tax=Streptosporangium subroseum TaxID=106412 RepID=UPI00344781E3